MDELVENIPIYVLEYMTIGQQPNCFNSCVARQTFSFKYYKYYLNQQIH